MENITTTYDAEGRAQVSYDGASGGDFMRIRMTQGGDLGGNSAWVQFEFDADQPVEVGKSKLHKPTLRATGTIEIAELLSFIALVAPLLNKATNQNI